MPRTGQVFCVDRMTSDYAERHPFDVDGFIYEVAQKHGADIERVRMFFNYGLGRKGELYSTHCPAKGRDKWIKDRKTGIVDLVFGKFPDYVNGCEPALIEAWNKGAAFHTKGLRQGDTLPAILPMTPITRLDDGGWIALFPKDMHFLEDGHAESADSDCYTSPAESVSTQPEPQQETPTMECAERLCREDDPLPAPATQPAPQPQPKPKAQRQPKRQPEQKQLDLFAEEKPASDSGRQILKAAGYMTAMTVALVVIWKTGLIIPIGLIGLATSGIIR